MQLLQGDEIEIQFVPLIQQYEAVRREYPHWLILLRIGDFYELLYDDAEIASDVLGITLIQRESVEFGGERIAMSGIPYDNADKYIERLAVAGYSCVMCDYDGIPDEYGFANRKVVSEMTPSDIPPISGELFNNN